MSETPEQTYERFRARLPHGVREAHPRAVGMAIQAADGDWRRVGVEPDGTVVVHNHPVHLGVGSEMPPVRREAPPEPPRKPDLLDHFREPT